MAIISLSKETVNKDIFNASRPAIIDVYADWCGPCQQMEPIFNELAIELEDKYVFAKVNVDDERELTSDLGVTSVPTFLFVKNGKVVARETGYASKEDLHEKILAHLG